MNSLIVSATEAEIQPSLSTLREKGCEVLITGVGMVATTYTLTKHLQSHNYDLVIQVGVGGAFDRSIPLGSLLFVVSDLYADLGAEDHGQYLDLYQMGLADKDALPFSGGKLVNSLQSVHDFIRLPKATGLTVNMVSGREDTIKHRIATYDAQVESMEGAAFHEICLREGVPFAQVRAISNYVTPRDKSQWQMKDAIINLNNWLVEFIDRLRDQK